MLLRGKAARVVRRREHDPLRVRSTRTSATWMALAVAVAFFVLLVIFIAQNNRSVPLHFFGGAWRVSEGLALIVAAVAGAAVVLAVGVGRIAQLRIAGRRHNRAAATTNTENVGRLTRAEH
jgi:uncharacterized integral membrane protein